MPTRSKSRGSTEITDRLSVLGEMTRLRLLRLLECEELAVGELADILQLPQSTVSRHLKILLEGGWIIRRSEGTASHYRMVPDELEESSHQLWQLASKQLGQTKQTRQDSNRLDEAIRQRATDTVSYFGRVAGEWDSIRTNLFGTAFTDEALLALIPSNWVIADLGCGTANVAQRLGPHVKHVHAVDMSKTMLAAARKRLGHLKNISFHHADLLDLPLPDACVDAAVISLVLHHVDAADEAIKEVSRIVRDGGRMVVIDMLAHDRAEYRHTMGHCHLGFELDQIEAWVNAAGLVVDRSWRLASDAKAVGPDLFAMVGVKSGG